MGRAYFQSSYTHDQLVEHFLLTPAELALVLACRGDANRCGMALLLKALPYLGYAPPRLAALRAQIAAVPVRPGPFAVAPAQHSHGPTRVEL